MEHNSYSVFNCLTCGAPCDLLDNGVYLCPCCGNVYRPQEDDKLTAKMIVATTLRQSAKFTEAEQNYRHIITEYPNSDISDAYWGLFLSRQNILFETDGKGETFPCFYRMKDLACEDTEGFKEAILFAEHYNPQKVKSYRATAEAIERARAQYQHISQNPPYDIFLCFKKTDEGGFNTKGVQLAFEIYNKFSDRYNIFFSERSLKGLEVRDYEPNIYYGLHTAKMVILICEKPEYLNATWMRNEWKRFCTINDSDSIDKCVLPVFMNGFNPAALPDEIWHVQGINDGRELMSELENELTAFFHKANKQKKTPKGDEGKFASVVTYCKVGEFTRAREIVDELSTSYADDYRVWTGYIRIVTDNYTDYHTNELSQYQDTASRLGLDLLTLDEDYAKYMAERRESIEGLVRMRAKSVDNLIANFPVPLKAKDCYCVIQARIAYDSLSPMEKAYVTLSADLVEAESKLGLGRKNNNPNNFFEKDRYFEKEDVILEEVPTESNTSNTATGTLVEEDNGEILVEEDYFAVDRAWHERGAKKNNTHNTTGGVDNTSGEQVYDYRVRYPAGVLRRQAPVKTFIISNICLILLGIISIVVGVELGKWDVLWADGIITRINLLAGIFVCLIRYFKAKRLFKKGKSVGKPVYYRGESKYEVISPFIISFLTNMVYLALYIFGVVF